MPIPDYFKKLSGIFENSTGRFSWDMKHCVDAMEQAVLSQSPPARMLVGLDAKFVLDPLSRLPAGCGFNFLRTPPAMMVKK